MSFTDDDLKRLKETTQVFDYLRSTHFDVEALIARLEAAETACELAENLPIRADEVDGAEDLQEALLVWRKAAGK